MDVRCVCVRGRRAGGRRWWETEGNVGRENEVKAWTRRKTSSRIDRNRCRKQDQLDPGLQGGLWRVRLKESCVDRKSGVLGGREIILVRGGGARETTEETRRRRWSQRFRPGQASLTVPRSVQGIQPDEKKRRKREEGEELTGTKRLSRPILSARIGALRLS